MHPVPLTKEVLYKKGEQQSRFFAFLINADKILSSLLTL